MKLKLLIFFVLFLCSKLALSHTEKSLIGYVGRGEPVGCSETMGVMLPQISGNEYSASELICEGNKYLTIQEKLGMDRNKVFTKIVYVLPLSYEKEDLLLVPSECKDTSNADAYIFAIGSFGKNPSYGEQASIKSAVSFSAKTISYIKVSKNLVQCTYYGSGD